PSGGRHKFYAYDPKVAVSGSNKLGSGIDISSNGHHVVLAPSYWPKADKFYRWVVPPLGTELPQLPKWVVEMLAPKPKRQPLKRINYGNMQGYRRQALADLEYQMRKIAGLAPFKAGAALGAYVRHKLLTDSEVEDAIMSACTQNGLCSKYSPNDLRGQIRNGLEKARGDALPPLARAHVMAKVGTDKWHQRNRLSPTKRPPGGDAPA